MYIKQVCEFKNLDVHYEDHPVLSSCLKQFLLSAGMTREHAVSRKQFGSPLSEFGLIQVKSDRETVHITTVRNSSDHHCPSLVSFR